MRILFTLVLFCSLFTVFAQDNPEYYPMGKGPDIRYNFTDYEEDSKTLFEANPILRLRIYNSFYSGLREGKKHTWAFYGYAQPQLRMYNEVSSPVKTPTYRLLLGTQHLYQIQQNNTRNSIHFLGFLLESGHYSNGQSGCAFIHGEDDESETCRDFYETITDDTNLSKVLNRSNGNFSTNMTRIIFNYRKYLLYPDLTPRKLHSYYLGVQEFHDRILGIGKFGGYPEEDKQIYGKHWYLLFGYEHGWVPLQGKYGRFNLKLDMEILNNEHPDVYPFRAEATITKYGNSQRFKNLGVYLKFTHGYDNYNYRFVDWGNILSVGVTWDPFPPFQMKHNNENNSLK